MTYCNNVKGLQNKVICQQALKIKKKPLNQISSYRQQILDQTSALLTIVYVEGHKPYTVDVNDVFLNLCLCEQ